MDTADTPTEEVTRLPLKALGIRTGMALQTRRLVEGASKKESQFYGAIEGKGVMVGPLGTEGTKTELEEGEVCVVRGFTGQYEFSFLSKVLQTFEKPFAYALLAYPAMVDAKLVRHSMRVKTSWPTTVLQPGKDGAATPQALDVTLIDISMSGTMIKAPTALAAIGEVLTLSMDAIVDNMPVRLTLAGKVCHNNRAGGEDAFCIGLAFTNLTQQDKLLLNYLLQGPITG
ncbi:PilZ domain-containing protein [Rhodoferax saidenbachensis]|uniref:PilZ domain-containing protein n=1 Tax=Rhodoferax saidenbachensis TaxID=1484693 RepID=A0A1P8KAY1_9BURK|nr:PilZ domain-containing protein [Rhodoferax saidenbachensis]APW43142.1 PilZ domain-containing protein [Rhodoferax saidenbachensis]